jgi:transcriptional regulator with XRE-family HTH domain
VRRRNLAQLQQDIGRRVAELRTARGATQAELAEAQGISQHYLQRIEAGGHSLSLRTLAWLSDVFKVDARELLEPPRSRAPRSPGRPRKRT